MKICKSLITFGLFAPLISGAQTGRVSDSLYFYGQESRQLTLSQTSATLLQAAPVHKVGAASLSWNMQSGSFRRSQEAQKGSTVAFYTEGFEQLGRFRIGGKFRFDNIIEDSLGWNLQGLQEEGQPYYFFAGKAGEYKRQNYKLDAVISYELLKQRLYISFGADYLFHWTTRSVDPRPDSKNYHLLLKPELSLRLGKQLAGINFVWGRGRDGNSVVYKNRNYAGNLTYQDRNRYLSLGYGHIARTADNGLYRYNYFSGAGLHYSGNWKNLSLQFHSAYLFTEQEHSLDDYGREKSVLYSLVQKDDAEADILLTRTTPGNRQQLRLNGGTVKTLNWSSEFQATNYQHLRNSANLSYWYRFEGKRKYKPELGLGIGWTDVTKEDVVVSHYLSYSKITPSVNAALYRDMYKSRLSAGIEATYHIPLQSSLDVPGTQINYFTQGIALPDYLFYSSKFWVTSLVFNWQTTEVLKRIPLGLRLNIDWSHQTAPVDEPLSAEPYFRPGGNRLQFGAAMTIYL